LENIVVVGAGGHARVVISVLKSMDQYRIVGATDARKCLWNTEIAKGVRVLGDDALLDRFAPVDCCAAIGVGGSGIPAKRKTLYQMLVSKRFHMPPIIHAFTFVAPCAEVLQGSQIMAGAVVQVESLIGENCIVNTSASVDHGCRIEGHCHIAPGAVLGGEVHVGEGTLVGLGARVLPGIRIGKGALIGAGAVVAEDVPDWAKVAGILARARD